MERYELLDRTEVLNRLRPWWRNNGWNVYRLERMPTNQLIAIYLKAKAQGWQVKRPARRNRGVKQMTLF